MKKDGLLFWLCMIETAVIVYIHYIVFGNLNGIAICNNRGRMIVLTITDYLLFFSVILGNIWKWCSAIFVIRLKGYNLLRLLTLIELLMCCRYLENIVIICCFTVHIIIDMEISDIIKTNANISINPIDVVRCLKGRIKNVLSLLLLFIIIANIIYILYPPREVYCFTESDGKWVYIEFQHSDNLSEYDNYFYIFRHYFILGEIERSTGKKYEISGDKTGDATVQIDKGFEMEKFSDHEKIVYRITPSYRFDGYLTPGYIMKVYAFNVAIMEACIIGFLVIWGFSFRIYDHSHRKM